MQNPNQSENENCCEDQCGTCKCKVPMIAGAIAFSLVMLALGIFLGKTYFSSSPKENSGISATPTVAVVPTTTEATSGASLANWKTYKNEKYGYEVKYPRNLFQNQCNDNLDLNEKETNDCGSERLPLLSVKVFPVEDANNDRDVYLKQAEDLIRKSAEQFQMNVEERTITVEGDAGMKIFIGIRKKDAKIDPIQIVQGIWSYRIKYNPTPPQTIFIISYISPKDKDLKYEKIYSQILSTFKFTEK